jgi:DNA-binding transcriptional MerR regulator
LRLKKLYSSREVAALTGLSARQLQWWHARRLFIPSIAPHKTDAGGYTERRYTPVELLELMVLADLRRRGFSIPAIRRLLSALRTHFKVRLFEAIEGGGPITLFIDGQQIYARTETGEIYNVLQNPRQPLLVVGEEVRLKQLVAKEGTRSSRKARDTSPSPKNERSPRVRRSTRSPA